MHIDALGHLIMSIDIKVLIIVIIPGLPQKGDATLVGNVARDDGEEPLEVVQLAELS